MFDIIFMLQHFVWFKDPVHQRVVIQVGKSSELNSPLPKESGKTSPFKIEIGPSEIESQRNNVEASVKNP